CQQCNKHDETVHHFVMACNRYARQRAALRTEGGTQASQLEFLLSIQYRNRELPKYIVYTRRLEKTFRDVTPPKPKER
ncbi:uncharacterized protein F5891DRAFT_938936, partial [Suillus fuscotomentosus]